MRLTPATLMNFPPDTGYIAICWQRHSSILCRDETMDIRRTPNFPRSCVETRLLALGIEIGLTMEAHNLWSARILHELWRESACGC